MTEKSEKKPMQRKNKILLAVITLLVIVGVVLGLVFGLKSKDSKDNQDKKSDTSMNDPNPPSNGDGTSNGNNNTTAPVPSNGNGTMINGVLFPYYNLQGPTPEPVGIPGTVYTNCKVPGTFSISYDDGPSAYTPELLDLLDKENIKVTFFVNGFNDGCIYDPKIQEGLKRAYNAGHQIASHTWTHPQLTKLTEAQITAEMTKVEDALKAVLGVVPRYMRPPYGDGTFAPNSAGDKKVQDTLKKLGYVITTWDIASGDADIDDNNPTHRLSNEALLAKEQNEYMTKINADPKGAPHMALQHDTYQRTVTVISPWAIKTVKELGYKIVPVGECLGEDPRNWYKYIGPAATTTPTTCTK
ncbi:Carbohydrate esterase 4 protein [Actinomortierella wolfii]|nr:Carbohydrate esterase 4 protein [Actinomortierella wolfii]